MNLMNKKVMHSTFGEGNIRVHSDSIIEVEFPSGIKKFVFPDAFDHYLSIKDKRAVQFIADKMEEREEERRQQELELEKEREQDRQELEHFILQERLLKKPSLSPRSQIAFWCQEEELDEIFSQWRVFTGVIKSGASKGLPKRPASLHQNSACLLTSRASDESEKHRAILGVYMVSENFVGERCNDGYIPAHSQYRLRLSSQESEKLPFWKYYTNEKYPQNITWNTGRYRYFNNDWMAQILRDILAMKRGTEDQGLMQEFYHHFCHINQIDPSQLPPPNGSLMRV